MMPPSRSAVTGLSKPRPREHHWPRMSTVLLYSVVILGSIATFIHSSWGFATLEAVFFEGIDFAVLDTGGMFWLRGALAATTLDLGILGFIRLIQEGARKRWIRAALATVAMLSGYTQFIYAVAHAAVLEPTTGVAPWLYIVAVTAAQVRVLILPWALPSLIIMYGFAAGVHLEEKPEVPGPTTEAYLAITDILEQAAARPTITRAAEEHSKSQSPVTHDAGGPWDESPDYVQLPLGLG